MRLIGACCRSVPTVAFLMKKRGLKNKQTDRKNRRGAELVFAFGDNENMDPERRNVQCPRVFYRRELEAQPLVVARPSVGLPVRRPVNWLPY